ncbi:CotY/CotZ family spore coat protein [Bacillus sp. Marseille-P3661]|uniref:CotY/CotZ family spore coat protein n=1 Tax=Bacillus sp. Marseille-P3661 TaxID=1936234 RepID=UPI000C82ADEA|nr:CotY/CotZ family spore coat protein [Bacillus sp. Marseille-P3661]
MSCGKGKHSTGNCVCDVVRAIADAQNDVMDNCCDVSCDRSIDKLLSPASNDLDTVPFILYCDGCKPFKAFGVDFQNNRRNGNNNNIKFECVESFLFRVKSVDEDCCALLELLAFADGDNNGKGGGGKDKDEMDPCDQINNQELDDLVATGICITVDLSCFCAITCLPAVALN